MVPVNRLPDLCLHALFRQMTLQDQLTARNVCRRWNDLVLEVTRNRRTLAIFIYDPYRRYEPNKWKWLNYGCLDEDAIQRIISTYSAINKLQLKITMESDYQAVINLLTRLLEQWQKTLVTLHFDEYNCRQSSELPPGTGPFFTALNALSSLQYLKLSISTLKLPDLSILRQLKTIEVEGGCRSEHLLHYFTTMLIKYITVDSPLVDIRYSCTTTDSQDAIHHFSIHLSEHIRSRFTLIDYEIEHTNLATICDHFRSLTRLCTVPSDITLQQLFGHLSKLTKLNHLQLGLVFADLSPENEEEDKDRVLLAQLPSVKTLKLKVNMRSHEEVTQMAIAWTMPSLESIILQFSVYGHSQCTTCSLADMNDNILQDNVDTAKGCLRAILGSLKPQYSKLPAIMYDWKDILGTAEELLAE